MLLQMNGISKNKAAQTMPGKAIRAALGDSGARVTAQRALILDIIARGKGHLDADEIYRRARQKKPPRPCEGTECRV